MGASWRRPTCSNIRTTSCRTAPCDTLCKWGSCPSPPHEHERPAQSLAGALQRSRLPQQNRRHKRMSPFAGMLEESSFLGITASWSLKKIRSYRTQPCRAPWHMLKFPLRLSSVLTASKTPLTLRHSRTLGDGRCFNLKHGVGHLSIRDATLATMYTLGGIFTEPQQTALVIASQSQLHKFDGLSGSRLSLLWTAHCVARTKPGGGGEAASPQGEWCDLHARWKLQSHLR